MLIQLEGSLMAWLPCQKGHMEIHLFFCLIILIKGKILFSMYEKF